ncbi:MAG: hypothetical protein H6605_00605 [Flavobacteriales bacterium]|nr:hypothetical protein [Flavobacteriales bacterium]
MLSIFKPGDVKTFEREVLETDVAQFDSGMVHPVYSTFALGRDAEWVCRLFVIDMKEEGEEGIGTFLNIKHHSPAFIGEKVLFTGIFQELKGNNIFCDFKVNAGNRLIAEGNTGQKILLKEKIHSIFNSIRGEGQ